MKTRAEIKTQAKSGFTSRYWPVVGIGLLGALLIGAMAYVPYVGWLLSLFVGTIITVGLCVFNLNVYRGDQVKVENLFSPFNRYGRVLGGSLWMALWLFLWSLIFIIPFFAVFIGGMISAIMSSIDFSGVYSGHMAAPDITPDKMFSMFLNPLWLLLFLLLIPAIIKQYSYFCTRYILADSPNVGAIEALTLSKKMMQGFKWKLFVTQLSFILWFLPGIGAAALYIASIGTFISAATRMYNPMNLFLSPGFGMIAIAGILGLVQVLLCIFYVSPYYNAAIAGFYDEVKQVAKEKGIESAELL